MTTAGPDLLRAAAQSHGEEPASVLSGESEVSRQNSIPATAHGGEDLARLKARRFALLLMALSGVVAVAVLSGLWWLLRGVL